MMVWTDERMDDLATRMDAGFARVDDDIRGLRSEIHDLRRDVTAEIRGVRSELKGDIHGLRGELKGDIAELRTEVKDDIAALQALTMRFGIVLLVGMIGMIATLMGVIATGALSA